MNTILIPTDFSKNAWHAISFALMFFKNETCNFYLLHTYSPAFYRMDYMMGGPEVSAIPDVGVDISLMGLETTLSDVKKEFPNPRHRFETLSSFNTLTDEVRELTQKKGIDLVVMGTKGASGAKQLFLGSNTVFVIRKAQVPVLAVPEDVPYHPVRTILFPSDYLSRYKREELEPVLHIARMHQSRFILLHVTENGGLTDAQNHIQGFRAVERTETFDPVDDVLAVIATQGSLDLALGLLNLLLAIGLGRPFGRWGLRRHDRQAQGPHRG